MSRGPALVPLITGLAVVLIVGFTVASFLGLGTPRSPSEYSGVAVDVEYEKGIVLKTTQIHLKTHPQASSVETFCVLTPEDDAIVEEFRGALQNGDRVTVHYSRPLIVSPWDCESGLSTVDRISGVNETA